MIHSTARLIGTIYDPVMHHVKSIVKGIGRCVWSALSLMAQICSGSADQCHPDALSEWANTAQAFFSASDLTGHAAALHSCLHGHFLLV